MDFIIKFVGIILIVGSTNQNVPYRALVPMSSGGERFCAGQAEHGVPKHTTYIRVDTTSIVRSKTTWRFEDRVPCTPDCTLFPITKASTVKIEGGFATGSAMHEHASYCLVPDVKAEMQPAIIGPRENSAIVTMDLPGGDLTAEQLSNGSYVADLHVAAPPEAAESPAEIKITIADADQTRVIILNPGSTITLLNATETLAVQELTARDPHAKEHAHFVLFNNVVQSPSPVCEMFGLDRIRCGSHIRRYGAGVVGDEVCSVGRIKG